MKDYSGYYYAVRKSLSPTVYDKIERDKFFTDAVSATEWNIKKTEVFLLSLEDAHITHIAFVSRSNRVVTGKNRIKFNKLIEFYNSISIQIIQEKLDNSLKESFADAIKLRGQRIPQKLWESLIRIIKELNPESSEEIDKLLILQTEDFVISSKEATILSQEKDAINMSFRISGFDYKEGLNWFPKKGNKDVAPFISGLESTTIIEDRMIEHDAKIFGDWKFIEANMKGYSVFGEGDKTLTIYNVNRDRVEKSLGVDLIYYFAAYHSYLII